MSTDAWSWSPDRPENPRPIHGNDSPIHSSRRADINFLEEDDPEAAQAYLDEQLALISTAREAANRLNGNMINVPIPPERQGMTPETVLVDEMRPILSQMTPDQLDALAIDPMTAPDAEEIRQSMRDALEVMRPFGRPNDPFTPTELGVISQDMERPNFPFRPLAGIVAVRISFRREDGYEEAYELDDPSQIAFAMRVEYEESQEITPMGFAVRRVRGLRELRAVLLEVSSPRNWRRLATRRWR